MGVVEGALPLPHPTPSPPGLSPAQDPGLSLVGKGAALLVLTCMGDAASGWTLWKRQELHW